MNIPNSLDDDILNLLDEVDLDELLNEMSVAILDKEKFSKFLIEKSREAVNRFLVSHFTGFSFELKAQMQKQCLTSCCFPVLALFA